MQQSRPTNTNTPGVSSISNFNRSSNSFYFASIFNHLEKRAGNKIANSLRCEIPNTKNNPYLDVPHNHMDNASYGVATKFCSSYSTRARSPMLTTKWFRDGSRIVSGNSCGELAIWNHREQSIEIGFSAHDTSVQCFEFNSTDEFSISVDHGGFIKYWQGNLNFVQQIFGHNDPARDISFSPTDEKFATCGDDGYIKVWDFEQCKMDISLSGHGSEVKCVDWHPTKGLIASGAKDSLQPVLLWDPRSATSLCTLHMHNNAVNDLKWNKHGNFLATCSKDKLIKLFDLRAMKEFATFRGHKSDIISIAWNPVIERLFATGSLDGSFIYWDASCPTKPVAIMENLHEGAIWSMSWHPLGHILVTSSNDCTNRVWVRNNIGESLDKFSCVPHKLSTGMMQSDNKILDEIPGIVVNDNHAIVALTNKPHPFLYHEPLIPPNNPINPISDKATTEEEDKYLYDPNVAI